MAIRIALAELAAAGITLQPAEAVAIVVELCGQRAARQLPGIPATDLIRITRDGVIAVDGMAPENGAAGADVPRAAHLLNTLLPGFDAPATHRVSGALRLAIARALGTLDLPPYATLDEFRKALARFAAPDPAATARSLFLGWERQQGAPAAAVVAPIPPPSQAPRPRRARSFAVPLVAATVLVLGLVFMPRTGPANPPADKPQPSARAVSTPAAPSAQLRRSPQPPQALPSSAHAPRLIQASAYSPSFARSGSTVYFHQQEGGASALKRADTDQRGRFVDVTSIVSDRALNFHPRPSPDGSQIAFDSDRDGVRAVFVADADGRNPRRISGSGFAAVPSWSPDGRNVAFVRAEPGHGHVWNLWLAGTDGSDLRRVTHHSVGQAWGGSWFPDGRRIAYSVETRLVVLNVVTGAKQTFNSPRAGRLVRTPAVSPQGDRIIFQVHHDGTWLMDVSTGAMHPVLRDPTAEEYTWAPDGRTVAFHSRRAGSWGVWVMAP